ncbi:hypothetical protein HZH68_010346 [Vespula germanica]|uniref:Uncharacterized protein n=1 Tax=Vespula germanica TaxID=30212 RepID=A0A834N227_VESGE|nr:hypothetical protein HZH68_010346 [Vespula germanica]
MNGHPGIVPNSRVSIYPCRLLFREDDEGKEKEEEEEEEEEKEKKNKKKRRRRRRRIGYRSILYSEQSCQVHHLFSKTKGHEKPNPYAAVSKDFSRPRDLPKDREKSREGDLRVTTLSTRTSVSNLMGATSPRASTKGSSVFVARAAAAAAAAVDGGDGGGGAGDGVGSGTLLRCYFERAKKREETRSRRRLRPFQNGRLLAN